MMDSTRNWDELDDDDDEAAIGMGTKSAQPRKKLRHDARN